MRCDHFGWRISLKGLAFGVMRVKEDGTVYILEALFTLGPALAPVLKARWRMESRNGDTKEDKDGGSEIKGLLWKRTLRRRRRCRWSEGGGMMDGNTEVRFRRIV